MLGAVEGRLGGGGGLEKILLTLESGLKIGDIGLRLLDLRQRLLVTCLQGQHLVAHRPELGLGRGESGFEGGRPQAEKHVALLHRLVLVHVDLGDGAGDVGGNAERLRLDVGIVGGHDLAADNVVVAADDQRDRKQGKKDRPPQAALGLDRRRGRNGNRGLLLRLFGGSLQRRRLEGNRRFQLVIVDDGVGTPLLAFAVQPDDLVARPIGGRCIPGGLLW